MSQMFKIIFYSVIIVVLIILLIYVSKFLIESIPNFKSNSIKNDTAETNPYNLISPLVGLITVIILCLTLFFQQRQHKETIVEQRNQFNSQIQILQKEHAFNYIDGLFEKFERNLVFNTSQIQGINENIILRCQEYLDNLEKSRSEEKEAREEAELSQSNEFWTIQEVEADIESLYTYIRRFNFLYNEIRNQEHLDKEIKAVYIENLKKDFEKISFKKAIDFVNRNRKDLKFIVDIFDSYNINTETLY